MNPLSGSDNWTRYSFLTTVIQLKKSSLTNLLNQQVDLAVNTLDPQPLDMGHIIFRKEGDLDITVSQTQINLEIPLTLHVQGEQLLSGLAVQAGIRLFFKSDIDLVPYWQLQTKTELERYLWLDQPDIQVSKLSIPVERIADQLLKNNREKLELLIDETISKHWLNAGIDKKTEAFFNRHHQLQADLPFYLRLSPEKIHITPATNEKAYFHSLLHNKLQISLTSIITSEEDTPLPTPSFRKSEDTKDSCYINVMLDYFAIEQLLQKQLIGGSFSYKSYAIKIKGLSLERTSKHIKITVSTSGAINGTIHIEGVPNYNEQTNAITMDIHDFQIKTVSPWKQIAANLLEGPIKSRLAEKLSFNLDDLLKREEVKKLKNITPAKGVKASVDVQKVQLSSFLVGKEAFSCLLHVHGETKLFFGLSE